MTTFAPDRPMAKKTAPKSEAPKVPSVLIRVSAVFADAIRDAASIDRVTVGAFADEHLLPIVAKRYRDSVLKAARKIEESK